MNSDSRPIQDSPRLLVGERVMLTIWIGSLWAIGYLAVPVLFNMLEDRRLAGELAGQMFTVVYMIGLGAGGFLLISIVYRAHEKLREWRVWVITLMLILLATGLFVLQPMMQDLKAQGELIKGSDLAIRFGKLHGVSSALYLVTSLLGLSLVMFGLQLKGTLAEGR